MPNKKSVEIGVQVTPGLTREQLKVIKEGFKNIVIATLSPTPASDAKQKPPMPKQALVKQRAVVKQRNLVKQAPATGRKPARKKR